MAAINREREPPCFTINACNRCRRRKAKCDPGLPSCAPCQRIGAVCEYTDPRSKTATPRASILALEDELRQLEEELQRLHAAGGISSRDAKTARDDRSHPDLIRLEPGEDAHFLGVSSGMHLARSVLESAQRNDASFQPGRGDSGSGSRSGSNSGGGSGSNSDQPTSASSTQPGSPRLEGQPDEDSSATTTTSTTNTAPKLPSGPILPSRETAISLIEIFLGQYEVQYPIVVGDDMANIVLDCYGERDRQREPSETNDRDKHEKDAWHQFILNMVFAIALVVLSRESPESLALAKTFSAAAMADFSTIMQRKSVRTLQCLLFLLLWSVIDSSSAPIWYISGLCMRMCVDLGFHSETTIQVSATAGGNEKASEAEMDVKRRLFWVTYTFDRTLGTLLGRPFTLTDSMIDVQLPRLALAGAKRDQILHWFKLQQLQSQIVSRLYSLREDNKVGHNTQNGHTRTPSAPSNADETTRWKTDMATQLRQWGSRATGLAEPSGHNLDWWEYWHQNAILLLHRPSPLKPQLDADEADTCCTAAQHMIQLSFTRLQRGSADFAWVDLHYQLMSGITLLFLVWKHAATRAKAKTGWTSFKNCLMQWTYVLDQLARQWERISRARDVLTRLVDTTIDIVEKELCNKLSASDVRALRHAHASRMSRNKTIIRQLGSPGAAAAAAAAASSSSSKDRREASSSQSPAEPPHDDRQHSHSTKSRRRSQSAQQSSQQPIALPSLPQSHLSPRQQHPQNQQQQHQQQQPSHYTTDAHSQLHNQPQQLPSHYQPLGQPHPQHASMHTGGPTPPQQQMQYERSSYGGTPSSDTAVNTSQSIDSTFLAQSEGNNNNNNNIYAMQVSPAHSGHQPISPQWMSATTASNEHQHPLPLVAPFHHLTDMVHQPPSAGSGSGADPVVQLLDQQAWHGLELYESFGAMPDNITMLDYFSTTPMPMTGLSDGSGSAGFPGGGGVGPSSAGGGGGHAVGGMIQHGGSHAGGHGGHNGDGTSHHAGGGSDMVGAWPDSLTNSILNFQPTFHDLSDFGTS
ncbi:hypothetical protein SBRCBS47491_003400 [Sporothrix bragantina]|uniref:Zn(2)-C6 fungal-type domain-containing protein n=1 Tax=Sporothrix bragantina TaxID=671064 RepID=A0ABP0BEY5_9PEZI